MRLSSNSFNGSLIGLSYIRYACNKTVGNGFHISYHFLGIYSYDISFCRNVFRPLDVCLIIISFILSVVGTRNDGFAKH